MNLLFLYGAGFLVSTLIGYLLSVLLWPRELSQRLTWAYVPGIGAGVSSLIFFLFRRPLLNVELTLLAVLLAAAVWYRRIDWNQFRLSGVRIPVLSLVLFGGLVSGLFLLIFRADVMPHGEWDGWAIWNSHARLLYRAGKTWRTLIPYTYHSDYPLLTPSLTARLWRYAGVEVPDAGAFIDISFALSAVAVLGVTLSELVDSSVGILLALVLVGTPRFIEHGASQYADVPLSFFILSSLSFLFLDSKAKDKSYGLAALAGFAAGCAGWTKNEGILFTAAMSGVLCLPVLWRTPKSFRRLAAFAAGLAAPALVIAIFKAGAQRTNYLFADRTISGVIHMITDPNRHATILRNVARLFGSFGLWTVSPLIPLAVFVLLRGIQRSSFRSPEWRMSAAILCLVAAGYYAVYLTTPIELQLQLDASLDRLMLQLWPSALLLIGLLCRPAPAV